MNYIRPVGAESIGADMAKGEIEGMESAAPADVTGRGGD
jgi:hypothetical protein